MINLISVWFRKRILGQHVCEEFTQWEYKESPWEKTSWHSGKPIVKQIVRCWQERRCTLCGKIQQEELTF